VFRCVKVCRGVSGVFVEVCGGVEVWMCVEVCEGVWRCVEVCLECVEVCL
jgi:hypothetical protein